MRARALAIIVGCCASTICELAHGAAALILENRFVAVEIDRATGGVTSITDKSLDATYAIFGEAPAAFQHNVISALSMSAYTQIGPGFKGLANPENRAFLAKWRAWASEHHAYLKVKRDLFDCPGDSAVDGCAHVIGDRGFVFLFPGGFDAKKPTQTVRATMPLNRWLGLDERPQSLYAVKEIYPRENVDLGIHRYGDEFAYDMPAQSAVILSIVPAPPGSEPHHPSTAAPAEGVIVVKAF